MKKLISFVLVLAVTAASFALAIPAGAAYDGFTVYCTPASHTLTEGDDGTVSVSLKLENNPGLWATRLFIVYPEGLSLDDGTGKADIAAGSVFSGADTMTLGFPDLSLTDSRQPGAFKSIIEDQAVPTEGYCSTCVYFESSSLYSLIYTNGTLATLNFRLTDKAEDGDVLDIGLYYGEYDFFSASISSSGKISFTSYYPAVYGADITVGNCPHPSVYTEHKDADCTNDGYDREICTQCKDVVSERVISAKGHDPVGKVDIIPSTCTEEGSRITSCTVCGEVVSAEVLPLADHSYVDTVVKPTRTEQGYTIHTCTVCGYEFKDSYVDALGGDPVTGDISGDDKLTAVDINIMRRVLAGALTPTDDQMKAGDINGDGVVNGVDANRLSYIIAGKV